MTFQLTTDRIWEAVVMKLQGIPAIADFISTELPADRRALVGIDGVDGSGKTTFANALSKSILNRSTVLIHLDDFLNPPDIRHRRGRHSPEGFWFDSYDYEALWQDVIEPLLPSGAGAYRTASFDPSQNKAVHPAPRQCATDAVVIIEGLFLHRDELVDVWDFSLFLDVPFDETARRMAIRDGSDANPEHPSMRRYVGGQRMYFTAVRPWERADLVIDNSDPEFPSAIHATQSPAR